MTLVRLPNEKKPVKIPEMLEPVFKDLDDTGLCAAMRGNGIYEITDAPLNTLRDRVREHVDTNLGGMLTDKETAFLEKCGINARDGYSLNSNTVFKWLNRWSLAGTQPSNIRLKNFKIAINIPKDTPYLRPEFIPVAEQMFRLIYLKLALASGLNPKELPSSITFVSPELTNHTALIAEARGDILPICSQLGKLGADFENPDKVNGVIKKLDRAQEYQVHHTSGKAIIMVEKLLAPINNLIIAMSQEKDPAKRQKVMTTLMSVYAFPFAHELGHQLLFLKGERLYQKVAKAFMEALPADLGPARSMFKGIVICTTLLPGYEQILEKFLDGGMFPSGTKDTVKNHYHNTELDADIFGMYLAIGAGFDPQFAGATLMDDVPESLTHPAEADTKAFLDAITKDMIEMGLLISP